MVVMRRDDDGLQTRRGAVDPPDDVRRVTVFGAKRTPGQEQTTNAAAREGERLEVILIAGGRQADRRELPDDPPARLLAAGRARTATFELRGGERRYVTHQLIPVDVPGRHILGG